MRPPDADGPTVLLGAADHRVDGPVDPAEEELARVLDLQRQRGVDDVGGGQPVVEPAALRPELLGDGVDEGGGVVVGRQLDLGDARR